MPKFRYVGPASETTAGIAGARFIKGVVNEVSDERLAAELVGNPNFEEVTADMLPAVTAGIRHAPRQGAPHPDPDIADMIQERARSHPTKTLDHEGVDGLGQINRADQFAANTEALAGERRDTTETGSDSGGEEVATPPASKPAGKSKAAKTEE
jgi:hypothetical protein